MTAVQRRPGAGMDGLLQRVQDEVRPQRRRHAPADDAAHRGRQVRARLTFYGTDDMWGEELDLESGIEPVGDPPSGATPSYGPTEQLGRERQQVTLQERAAR